MKKVILLSVVTLSSIFATAQQLKAPELINISGKQRMLSQQSTKAYIMTQYGSTNAAVQKEALIANKIFQKNLKVLSTNLTNDRNIYPYLVKEKEAYNRVNSIINTFSTNDAEKLMLASDNLLKVSNELVVKIKDSKTLGTGSELADIINMSGKQRMLNQRLVLLFMFEKFKEKLPKSQRYHTPILPVVKEMEESINTLSSFSGNSIDIDSYLAEISIELDLIINEKFNILNGEASINFVYQTTNKLTRMYDRLTAMYTKLNVE